MAKRKKFIQIPPENVQKLQKSFNCSRVAVYNALAYRSESDRAKAIRDVAKTTYGGIETYKYVM